LGSFDRMSESKDAEDPMTESKFDESKNEDFIGGVEESKEGDNDESLYRGMSGGRIGIDSADGTMGSFDNRGDTRGDEDFDLDDDGLADVMNEDFGDELPHFASEENRKIDRAVKKKEAKFEVAKKVARENRERVSIMKEHLKNVRQEISHTERLIEAKLKEVQTEEHLAELAKRRAGTVENEIKKTGLGIEEEQDRINMIQNDIFKCKEKMEVFKQQMEWNQDELEQWALAAKQKEEDNIAIEKYTRADEAKVKELTLQIAKITEEVSTTKTQLEDEVTETQAKQIELDKTAEEFRRLHRERQKLVKQWEDSLKIIERRDADIIEAKEIFVKERMKYDEKKEELENSEAFFAQTKKRNEQDEALIRLKELQGGKLRESWAKVNGSVEAKRDEIEVTKNQLAKAANDCILEANKKEQYILLVEQKKKQIEHVRKLYAKVSRELKVAKSKREKAEISAREAEELLKKKEAAIVVEQRNLEELKKKHFKESQILFNLRQREANCIAEISGSQASSRNLQSKITKLDVSAMRQQELIYNAEFQIQQLERKVARASGERSDEEKVVLNEKIKVLQGELDKAVSKSKMLDAQVKKIQDELRKAKRTKQLKIEERANMRETIAELELVTKAAEDTLKATQLNYEELTVEHDVIKLEVKTLNEKLREQIDEVYNQENRIQQIKLSMQERRKEIDVHASVQFSQQKTSEEERHKVAVEKQERLLKVEKLKSKYATTVSTGDDDKSQAMIIIEAAQRREELQRRGDELDVKIRKEEKEIRALEKTLKALNKRNIDYRGSFKLADLKGSQAKQLRRMEEQVKTAKDMLFKKKKKLQGLGTQLEDDSHQLEKKRMESEQLMLHRTHLMEAAQQVDDELEEQKRNLEEAEKEAREARNKLRKARKLGADEVGVEERIFEALALRETRENVLVTLSKLANEFPEMQDLLEDELAAENLSIPATRQSRMSERE